MLRSVNMVSGLRWWLFTKSLSFIQIVIWQHWKKLFEDGSFRYLYGSGTSWNKAGLCPCAYGSDWSSSERRKGYAKGELCLHWQIWHFAAVANSRKKLTLSVNANITFLRPAKLGLRVCRCYWGVQSSSHSFCRGEDNRWTRRTDSYIYFIRLS